MPTIPNPPTRDELKLLMKGGPAAGSAVERIIGWIEAVNSALKVAGIGQAPLPMPPGGVVALPANQRPLPVSSGEFVVGIVVMLADGSQAVISPEYLDSRFPSLSGYWKTDGSSSPSTGPWTLAPQNGDWSLTITGAGNGTGGLWVHTQEGIDSDWCAMFGGNGVSQSGAVAITATNPQSIVFLGDPLSHSIFLGSDVPTEARIQTTPDADGRLPLFITTLVDEALPFTYDMPANTFNVDGDSMTFAVTLTLDNGGDVSVVIDGGDVATYTPVAASPAEIRVTLARVDNTTIRVVLTVWENGEPCGCSSATSAVTGFDTDPVEVIIANGTATATTLIQQIFKAPAP